MNNEKKVIIIGAGLGGISAAAYLRQAGYEVEIIEKNDHPGGKLNELKTEGFTFDLGPSIVTLPHIFADLFAAGGRDFYEEVDVEKLDLQWRCFFPDDTVIDLTEDLEKMLANPAVDKNDLSELKDYMDYSKNLYELTDKGYFAEGVDTLWEVIKFYGLKDLLFGFDYFSTMHDGVKKRVSNPYLVDLLDYFIKYVGSSAYDAPAVLNLLAYIQHEFGLWYIKGGLYNMGRALENMLDEIGVKIRYKSEVKKLLTEGKVVKSVVLDDGSEIKGDIIVSNMEVIPTYRDLLGESENFLSSYDKFEPACSGLVLHLGVDKEYPQLSHHNFFFSGDSKKNFAQIFQKKVLPEDPTIYLVASTRTDKRQAPAGCENIKVLPHIPHLQDQTFTEDEYDQLRERVLDKLENMGLTDLRQHIIVEDRWTPEDIKEMYMSNRGAIYGVVSDRKKNKGFKAPKESEKYNNLFFVGGSVNPGGGMPMVILSGKQVSEKIKSK